MRPEQDFHLRQIDRLTGVPASSARRELQRFIQAGLAKSRRVGNQVRYQADRGCVVFDELASMLRKTVGMADVLREALSPLSDQIETAFLFGSVAQGREGPYSDVDLMVINAVSFESIVEAVHGAQEKLGREVNPVILRPRDFKAKLKGDDAFVRRVMSEPKIMILGTIHAAEAAIAAMKEGKSEVLCEQGQLVKVSKTKDGVVKREVLTKHWTDWVDYWAVDFDYQSRK